MDHGEFLIEIFNPPGVLGWGVGICPCSRCGGMAWTRWDVMQWTMDDFSLRDMPPWGNA
jgi:hypothetical protein